MSAGYSKPDWNRISAYYRGHQRAIIEAGRDDVRQAEIEDLGWHVYRITGADCRRDDVHDDNCNRLLSPSPGRELLRMVCELHDIRVCRQIMEAH